MNLIIVILNIALLIMAVPLILYPFAKFSKRLRSFYCKIGWHSYTHLYIVVEQDVCTQYKKYKCPWCGYEGLVDSQGNLF